MAMSLTVCHYWRWYEELAYCCGYPYLHIEMYYRKKMEETWPS